MDFVEKLKTGDVLIWKNDNYFNLGKKRSAIFVRVWGSPYVVTLKCNEYALVSWNDFSENIQILQAHRNPYKVLEESCAKKLFTYIGEPELDKGIAQVLYNLAISSNIDHLLQYFDNCGWKQINNSY